MSWARTIREKNPKMLQVYWLADDADLCTLVWQHYFRIECNFQQDFGNYRFKDYFCDELYVESLTFFYSQLS